MINVSKLTDTDIGRWVAYLQYTKGQRLVTNKIGQYKGYDAMAGMIRVYWPKLKRTMNHFPGSLVFIKPPDKELFE